MIIFARITVFVHSRVFADLISFTNGISLDHPSVAALSAAIVALAEHLRSITNDLSGGTRHLKLLYHEVDKPFIVQATEEAVALALKDLVVSHGVANEILSS